jgi:hypothetical protein
MMQLVGDVTKELILEVDTTWLLGHKFLSPHALFFLLECGAVG